MTARLAEAVDSSASGQAAPPRSAWHDNIKFAALVLVVLGHWGVARQASPDLANAASDVIYAFHMPLLIMISGRFVRPGTGVGRAFRRSWGQLVLPFVIFTIIDIILVYNLNGRPTIIGIRYGLWFLISLTWWRMIAGAIPPAAAKFALLVAVPLSMFGTYLPNELSLPRTVVFLPLFLFGMVVLKDVEPFLRRRPVRLVAVALLLVMVVIISSRSAEIDYRWMQGSFGAGVLGGSELRGFVIRAGLLVLGVLASLAFIAVIPDRRLPFVSAAGQHTLYIYLLHLPIARLISRWFLPRVGDSATAAAAIVVGAFVYSAFVTLPWVRRVTQPFVDPVGYASTLPSR